MGRVTVLSAENMTLGTGNVLAAFQTAAAGSAASNVKVKRVEISQNHNTTLAAVRGAISTRNTSGTLTMTAQAPTPIRPIGSAASGLSGNTSVIGGTGRSGVNSSADSGGTYADLQYFNAMNLNGYLYKPDPLEEIWVPPSTVVCVRFLAAPGDTAGWTIMMVLEED